MLTNNNNIQSYDSVDMHSNLDSTLTWKWNFKQTGICNLRRKQTEFLSKHRNIIYSRLFQFRQIIRSSRLFKKRYYLRNLISWCQEFEIFFTLEVLEIQEVHFKKIHFWNSVSRIHDFPVWLLSETMGLLACNKVVSKQFSVRFCRWILSAVR